MNGYGMWFLAELVLSFLSPGLRGKQGLFQTLSGDSSIYRCN